jgi:DNA polymerase III delta prime subunit
MGLHNIFGHERQKSLLLSFLKNERLPHALLFVGQDGIGKKKLAIEFIKHILCDTGSGCGSCRACLKVEKLSHPDFLYIEPRKKRLMTIQILLKMDKNHPSLQGAISPAPSSQGTKMVRCGALTRKSFPIRTKDQNGQS